MSTGPDDPELVRLAQYSMRLRALLVVWRRNRGRYLYPDAQRNLARLVKDIKLKLGEPISRRIYYSDGLKPETYQQAQRFLQRPEVLDSEHYQELKMRTKALKPSGLPICSDWLAISKQTIRLAKERGVPLAVWTGYVSPAVQNEAFVKGLTPIPAQRSPYCFGRAVLFGHAVDGLEPWFDPLCLEWLNQIVGLASAVTGVFVGFSDDEPGEYLIADEDGLLFDAEAELPVSDARDEQNRLQAYYLGEPWVEHLGGSASYE